MELHPDFRDLLAEFGRFGVEYALIGGYAVGYCGKPRRHLDMLAMTSAMNVLFLDWVRDPDSRLCVAL
jgi:hypothetical protein